MTSQLFKEKIPLDIFIVFLKSCSVTKDETYTFGTIAYKKACFVDSIVPFINKLKLYYYSSKQHYIERKMTQKNLITVIRQVCKYMNIPYISKMIYVKSSYEIVYYIYMNNLTNTIAEKQFSHNGIAF